MPLVTPQRLSECGPEFERYQVAPESCDEMDEKILRGSGLMPFIPRW